MKNPKFSLVFEYTRNFDLGDRREILRNGQKIQSLFLSYIFITPWRVMTFLRPYDRNFRRVQNYCQCFVRIYSDVGTVTVCYDFGLKGARERKITKLTKNFHFHCDSNVLLFMWLVCFCIFEMTFFIEIGYKNISAQKTFRHSQN